MEIEGLDRAMVRDPILLRRAHKLFMQFTERWWENNYESPWPHRHRSAIRNVVYPPAGQDRRIKKA